MILKNLSDLYDNPIEIEKFEIYLSNIEKYGIVFKVLKDCNLPNFQYSHFYF